MQRFFDISLSLVALVALAPFLLPIIAVLRLTGEGEIVYTQERVGLGGQTFYLLKLATMLKDSPNIGAGEVTMKNDPRVLPFGQFLRKTKLNELPQLINILRGDLSIVGPRPTVPDTFALYPVDAQAELSTVRPGLSGVGSIIFRDEESYLDSQDDPHAFFKDVIIPHKAELEQWYVRNRSLRLYFEAIFLTAWVILFPDSKLIRKVWPSLPAAPVKLIDKHK